MQFHIITIFPRIFDSYFNESIVKRAQAKGLVKIKIHDLRDFAAGKHKIVDDRPYGGGPGMVLKIEPLAKAIGSILRMKNAEFPPEAPRPLSPAKRSGGDPPLEERIKNKARVILFSPAGNQFNNKIAARLAKNYDQLILICGHYEGIDERIKKIIENCKLKIENLSIGPYVLTGGELPAMVLADAVSRQIPGVLGKGESLEEKRFGPGAPVYTRPEVFVHKGKKYPAPKVLLSGDHKKIEEWRKNKAKGV